MWRMLLPYYLLFLISIILFLKTDIRILSKTDLARLVMGTIFLVIIIVIGERSEPLSMVFNDQSRNIYIYMADVRPYVRF